MNYNFGDERQIEILRDKINLLTNDGKIKLTNEVLKLSEELDQLINKCSRTYHRELNALKK